MTRPVGLTLGRPDTYAADPIFGTRGEIVDAIQSFHLEHATGTSYLSGADKAYRYPAAGIVTLDQHDGEGNQELLLLSFHATSGFGAYDNCQAYFDSFYQNVIGRGGYATAVPLVWIVGGDFNC